MSEQTNSGGIGFCGLLAVVFIALKLCKVITWSWWWVLSPLWLGFAIAMLILVVLLIIKKRCWPPWKMVCGCQ